MGLLKAMVPRAYCGRNAPFLWKRPEANGGHNANGDKRGGKPQRKGAYQGDPQRQFSQVKAQDEDYDRRRTGDQAARMAKEDRLPSSGSAIREASPDLSGVSAGMGVHRRFSRNSNMV